MYDFEQNKKNNLILYGVRGRSHENTDSLRRHLSDILRDHLNIRREVPIARATRIHTGPCLFETLNAILRSFHLVCHLDYVSLCTFQAPRYEAAGRCW